MLQTMNIDNPDNIIKQLVDEYHDLIKNNDTLSNIVKQILDKCYDIAMSESYAPPKVNNQIQFIGVHNMPNEDLNDFNDHFKQLNDHIIITFEEVDNGEFSNGFCKNSEIHLIIHHEDNVLPQLVHRHDVFILRTDVKLMPPELLNVIINTHWPSTSEWISNVMYMNFDDFKPSANGLSPDRYMQARKAVNRIQTNIKSYLIAYKSYLSGR